MYVIMQMHEGDAERCYLASTWGNVEVFLAETTIPWFGQPPTNPIDEYSVVDLCDDEGHGFIIHKATMLE